MSDDVLRFVGASVARMPGSVIGELLAMRRVIAPFNRSRGLRTALLYAGGWFVQWHEGPAQAVDETWDISRSHAGHSHPREVHRSRGPASLVEPVQIAALLGPDKATDVARRLFEIEREGARAALAPADIWRGLAAPPSLPLAGGVPLRGDFRCIAVVSEHAESVEVVRAIAERCRVAVSYQRFAGADPKSGDAGAAYADVGCAGRHTRVHALSKHALGYSLVRLSLVRLKDVVLLAGRHPGAAAALSRAVVPLLAGFAQPPSLHVSGDPRRSHVDVVVDLIAGLHPPTSPIPAGESS